MRGQKVHVVIFKMTHESSIGLIRPCPNWNHILEWGYVQFLFFKNQSCTAAIS